MTLKQYKEYLSSLKDKPVTFICKMTERINPKKNASKLTTKLFTKTKKP